MGVAFEYFWDVSDCFGTFLDCFVFFEGAVFDGYPFPVRPGRTMLTTRRHRGLEYAVNRGGGLQG